MSETPKFTQRMTLHLNGGSEFSELHYVVLADGEETKITRHTRTDGSPRYNIVADEMHFGSDTFDFLKDKGAIEWIEARLGKEPPASEKSDA